MTANAPTGRDLAELLLACAYELLGALDGELRDEVAILGELDPTEASRQVEVVYRDDLDIYDFFVQGRCIGAIEAQFLRDRMGIVSE